MREFKINGVEIPIDIPVCHREMYAEWVERGKPQMEFFYKDERTWLNVTIPPNWVAGVRYRFKDEQSFEEGIAEIRESMKAPLDERSKAMRHLVDELPIAKFDPRIVKEADAKVEAWMDSASAHGIMASPEQLAAGLPKAEPQEHDAGQPTSALQTQVGGDHYAKMKIQPAKYCHANGIGHMAGDAISYITRYKDKNGKQDLLKAIHSLQLLIELEYGDEG